LALLAVVAAACRPAPAVVRAVAPPPAPATTAPATPTLTVPAHLGTVPVMGSARVTAAQIAAWYDSKNIQGARSPIPVAELAQLFLQEGRMEGVAGDLAFVQAMLETGWLRFSTRMPPEHNNFSGIGAVDGGSSSAAFPSPRIGVRAQIQHLRAYADPTVTVARLANPLESPRFHLVSPKGKAPTWNQFGNGNWATDPQYAAKILNLYDQLLRHARVL
jgi:flagellum-specific peptidoglycan hydrolase FlgJ